MHVFLSPHLDDVVLSCGARIARLCKQGENVVILTVMAGEPPDALPDTPLLRAMHDRLEGVNKAIITRRNEDAQAALCLGVKVYHLSLLECQFRTVRAPEGAMPLYPSDESMYGPIHPDDDCRITLLAMPMPFREDVTAIYAPLAAGNHVDHQLVRDWALVLAGPNAPKLLHFYGEYPYLLNQGAVGQALHLLSDAMQGLKLVSDVATLEAEEVESKMAALRCYTTHMSSSWDTLRDMELAVREWMRVTGTGQPAERAWHVVKETGMLSPL